ncbi:MAG: baseplate J/gp47 family protein, partial [Oscillospiraceae bacterium]
MELKTIHNRMLENISDEYEKSKGEFIYDETMAAAIEIEKLHSKADEVIDKGFAETTSGRDLERICYEKDVYRHQATFATGTVTINGANGTAINSGQLVASDSAVFGII